MNKEQIIRAWKDEEYRSGLGEAESALLPEHPAGIIEIPEPQMDKVAGATLACTTGLICQEWFKSIRAGGTCHNFTLGCCSTEEQQ